MGQKRPGKKRDLMILDPEELFWISSNWETFGLNLQHIFDFNEQNVSWNKDSVNAKNCGHYVLPAKPPQFWTLALACPCLFQVYHFYSWCKLCQVHRISENKIFEELFKNI